MERKIISTDKAPKAIGAYSQAVVAGNFVFVSGQIGFTPAGELVGDKVEEQAKQAMQNIQAILQAAGTSLDKAVKFTIFLSDINDFAKVNEVYASFFEKDYPARAALEVARLPKDVRVEIECIALV